MAYSICMNITLEVLIILLLIVVNGFFAGSEIAVVASRKARLQRRAGAGDRRAARALELANDPDRFLSTVQIGITLVGVSAGAVGGTTIALELAAALRDVPPTARYAQPLAVATVVACITFLSLVIGELVPKRLALAHAETIASRTAGFMHRLSRVATPLVRLLGAATNGVLRLLPVREPDEPAVTTDDVRTLLEQGARAGIFLAAEQDIVENVFWLGDQRVGSVMTPRRRIVWLDRNVTAQQHAATMRGSPQNRYIVCNGDLDTVEGVVTMKDLWPHVLEGRALDITAHLETPLFVPAETRALTVLEQFRKTGIHVALVQDESGRTLGIVTLSDILEGLVGELAELAEDAVVQRADGSWLVSGSVSMHDVRDLLGLPEPGDDEAGRRRLGAFVAAHLGHVPQAAEYFEWEGYRLEVVDMDGQLVDKVLVSRTTPTSTSR
ncbi:MAG TPA: hemolysin family protein [Longimicrobiales bacterium]|nr:hemolysin family protein [Longimicrobiales bacterium]